ncbi:MAG: MotA/TolQ/ExbB proton channel family protein [Alphaproteobacteria bacterium]|nr:MotA/TolQ/ExbB proton channel family protein [Alphaproteobacteria bacterium]
MVMMWYALGVRAWTLRRPRVGDLDGLLKHARQGRTLVDAAVRAMVAERGRRGAVQRGHLDAVVAPYKAAFEQYGTLVRSAVAVGPLAGLLGTVTGMIETFDSLGSMELFGRGGGGIGAGISEAMISTQMGLVVAVPGLLIGAMLERRQTVIEDELDAVAERLVRGGEA